MGELRLESLSFFFVLKVSTLHAPSSDGLCNSIEELSSTRFSVAGPQSASEVFRGHDIGCCLGPERWYVDFLLFENYLTLVVSDRRVSLFPLDYVIRVDSRFSVPSLVTVLSERDLRYLMGFHYSILPSRSVFFPKTEEVLLPLVPLDLKKCVLICIKI